MLAAVKAAKPQRHRRRAGYGIALLEVARVSKNPHRQDARHRARRRK